MSSTTQDQAVLVQAARAIEPVANVGQPQEQLEVEEEAPAADADTIVYPTGAKFQALMASLFIVMMMGGLDITILATAVPSITNEFKTVADIGWYSAVYRLTSCAFLFMFGKLYSVVSVKRLYLISLVIFETGSLLCTVSWTSKVFIFARAVLGFGAGGLMAGVFVIITQSVPLHRRPLIGGIAGGVETVACVTAPVLGGVLTDKVSWRACFGINLPLGVIAIAIVFFFFKEPRVNPDINLPWKEKVGRLDLPSTAIFVPSIICLMLALQWGGANYGWNSGPIIALFCVFGVTIALFGYLQYKRQDKAIVPPRILKQRSIICGAWFAACCNATLAVVEYYIAIYFQAVKGYSAAKSGVLLLPQIVGLCIACVGAGAATTAIGYYAPFMIATSILTPIAAGLLTTTSMDIKLVGLLCYQGLLGFGIGLGVQGPQVAAQTVLSPREASIGIGIVMFFQGMGPALMVPAAQTIFQSRLTAELNNHAAGTNVTSVENMGLSDIRNYLGGEKLKEVLLGYDDAVTKTLYLPLALTCLTLLGSLGMEWRSVKKKQS